MKRKNKGEDIVKIINRIQAYIAEYKNNISHTERREREMAFYYYYAVNHLKIEHVLQNAFNDDLKIVEKNFKKYYYNYAY